MRLWDSINRYFAFKLKEAEFRVHTWKRSREISRAYDAKPKPVRPIKPIKPVKPAKPVKIAAVDKPVKVVKPVKAVKPVKPAKPPKPPRPVRPPRPARKPLNIAAALPYAVKGAKFLGIAVAVVALVFGAVFAFQRISVAVAAARADSNKASADDNAVAAPPVQNIPEDAVLPEAAVLPEGFAENAATAVPADTTPMEMPLPQPERQAATPSQSDKALVDLFMKAAPHGVSDWLVLVDKRAKVMYFFKEGAGGWEVAKAYSVATGERDGRKTVEGDKMTPEGVYFMIGRKHRSELTNIYGPAAFILDYPNEDDRRERRTGHGIWMHGSERGNIPPLFTQGCVAVANQDILEIAATLKSGWPGVPVVIVSGEEEAKKHVASVDFQKLKARRAEVVSEYGARQSEFEGIVTSWKTAWESRDIDTYSTFYFASGFMDGAMNWTAFRDRKKGLFASYSAIYVDLSNIALTEYTDNMATVKFFQVYNTNRNNRMENAKRLIFRKDDQGQWKIYREIPFPKEELLL
ncbi:MAG: L,D-transpeptidase family protein [Chitinispirillales bacterium]|jgi:murein L,D-transpeptidase YafK|nr:L,D-transpeptidase family protein [Chitinispirillales bacterium]